MWNKQSSLKVAEALADGRNFLGEALDAEVLLRYVL